MTSLVSVMQESSTLSARWRQRLSYRRPKQHNNHIYLFLDRTKCEYITPQWCHRMFRIISHQLPSGVVSGTNSWSPCLFISPNPQETTVVHLLAVEQHHIVYFTYLYPWLINSPSLLHCTVCNSNKCPPQSPSNFFCLFCLTNSPKHKHTQFTVT